MDWITHDRFIDNLLFFFVNFDIQILTFQSQHRIRNLLKKGDNLLNINEGTFNDETNPALTLINMAKESAKYKTRMEEINEFNEVLS